MEYHSTHKGRRIYKSDKKFVVRFRWGDDMGEDLNHFSSISLVKGFIDRVIIGEHKGVSLLDRHPYTMKCTKKGCDNRPFKISQEEMRLAEGVLRCFYCGEYCEVQD